MLETINLKHDAEDFKSALRENIRPSGPISDPQLLKGWDQKLKEIEQAFNALGRHIFIFGDRGVGKTSLALTAATLKHPSTSEPPCIGCTHESTFFDLIADLLVALVPDLTRLHNKEVVETISGGFLKLIGWERSKKTGQPLEVHGRIRSMNEAVQLISEALKLRNEPEPVVIVDEFDAIQSEKEKRYFAEFIKFIYDRRIPIRFIFCGISKSIDELVGYHPSASRPFTPIELERLGHEARWAVIENAADKLNVDVHRNLVIRIGQISDGFPYYVHLIGERLFWNVFEHISVAPAATSEDFTQSLKEAIDQCQAPLRNAYKQAVEKTKNSQEYEHALWSIADTEFLLRQFNEIYDSYLRVMDYAPTRKPLDKDGFRRRIYSLVKDSHGHIIERQRNGRFQFRENIVRGYVRLVAEKQGVRLGRDHL